MRRNTALQVKVQVPLSQGLKLPMWAISGKGIAGVKVQVPLSQGLKQECEKSVKV